MQTISWLSLAWCIIPIVFTCLIYLYWKIDVLEVLIGSARMLVQLIGVGYLLIVMFLNPSWQFSSAIMLVMLSAATWIAIRPVRHHRGYLLPALIALTLSVALHLFISAQLVLNMELWYAPKIIIPLAGMYFANTMNSISLAAERFHANLHQQMSAAQARDSAFKGAMIPQINTLLAVGLVSLPGMMTGQILSDVSPLIAVRYQIMIMTMLLGASAMGAAIMLWQLERNAQQLRLPSNPRQH
ncbi:MAG: ABC transporter permease [Oceanospirillaceae bacterium]|nr:ABC transporter permease [Oceanospirillaceae bacterium]